MPLIYRGSLCLFVGSGWSLAWMWGVLIWCTLVCLWHETSHHCCWNQGFQDPQVGRWGVGRDFVWCFGVGATCSGTEASITGKDGSIGAWASGAWCKKLDSKCGPCTDSHSWPCVYANGEGREMAPVSSCGSLWMLPFCNMLPGEQIISPLCAPSALQIAVSMLYVHRLFACFFSKNSPNALWTFSELSTLTFKTLGFKPHWLQELTTFGPFHFPSQLVWGFVLPVCSSVCQTVSHPSLWPLLLSYLSGTQSISPQFGRENWISVHLTSLMWTVLYDWLHNLFCQSSGWFRMIW